MTIEYSKELTQGDEWWLLARTGILTASETKHIIRPTLKVADNDKARGHLYELASQRVTGYVEPSYISDDMLRGQGDEIHARAKCIEKYEPVEQCGFITNDEWGFTLGYSPDGLTDKGQIEIKSRKQKYQLKTINEEKVPEDYVIQVQTGLLVSRREYCDFISYCGGMKMFVLRVYPDDVIQKAIIAAATSFHEKLEREIKDYGVKSQPFFPTERVIEQDITI